MYIVRYTAQVHIENDARLSTESAKGNECQIFFKGDKIENVVLLGTLIHRPIHSIA